jgi:hypothetical protein
MRSKENQNRSTRVLFENTAFYGHILQLLNSFNIYENISLRNGQENNLKFNFKFN